MTPQEALDWAGLVDAMWADLDDRLAIRTLAEAARLVAQADHIWWCQNHDASGDEYACYRWRFVTGTVNSGDCRMVRRGLLPPEMEG